MFLEAKQRQESYSWYFYKLLAKRKGMVDVFRG